MYVPSFFKLVNDWFPDTQRNIKSTMYSIFAQRANLLTQISTEKNQLLNIDIDSLSFPANFFLFLFNNSIVPGLQINELTGIATSISNAIDKNSFNSLTNITLTDTALSVSDLEALKKKTNKTLNLSSVTNLTGVATSIINAIDTNSFNNLTNITLTDTALSVSDLEALKKKTNKTLNLSSVTNLTGVATSIINAINTNSFNSLTDITLTDTELSISKFSSLKTTNKTLNLSSVTELTGALTSIINAIDKNSFNSLTDISLTDITLTDNSLSVSDLDALIDVISPNIDATSVTELTGDRNNKIILGVNPNIILPKAVIPTFWSNPLFIGGGIVGIVGIGGIIYYLRKRNKD